MESFDKEHFLSFYQDFRKKFIDSEDYVLCSPEPLPEYGIKSQEFYMVDYATSKLKYIEEETNNGLILEFGVHVGHSINTIALNMPDDIIYGFDSFEGIPEAWIEYKIDGTKSGREFYPKNGMTLNKEPPKVKDNVKLIKGWFKDVLPEFMKYNNKPIKFMHIDCDIYSSTKDIFASVKNNIVNGTIIVFDELFMGEDIYNEFKAFYEFLQETKYNFEVIGRNKGHTQWIIKIII